MHIAIGIIVGSIIGSIIFRIVDGSKVGVMEVDESDPTDVKWKLIITKDIDFTKCRSIYFKVVNKTRK